ncbi:hypothetical protein N657DRAFT_234493 [Parathielavia appendiculata]|uniref:Uncharacterized protein n=1 Tax=Parathielavia appendiculata TaxID=2587402 RepID=A0AAN6U7I4_9PEZI|nr:hypothetical protein N657DRAFT_234493 [Parathielavia appendiculata]
MAFNIATDGDPSKAMAAAGPSSTRFSHPSASRPPSGLLPYDAPSSRGCTTIGQLRPTAAEHAYDASTSASRDSLQGTPRRKRQRIDADRLNFT